MSHDNTAAELLRQSLVTATIGTLPSADAAWPIFVNHMPDTPDNAICVYDTAGTTDGRNQRTGATIDHPGFQVKVRSKDHPTGYPKIKAIAAHLDSIKREQVAVSGDDYTIHAATRRGTILPLGQEPDKKRRDAFTVNGITTVEPITP